MKPITLSSVKPDHILVQGHLTFANIDIKSVNAFTRLLHEAPDNIILDLGQATDYDSAGLALLIEWLKIARHKSKKIVFANIPAKLLAIAQLSGFEKTLLASQLQENNLLQN